MRRSYREIDRPTTWADWVAEFSRTGGEPGETIGSTSTPIHFVTRALTLLGDFAASLPDGSLDQRPLGPIVLSGSPEPPLPPRVGPDRLVGLAEITSLTAVLEALRLSGR